MPTFQEWLNQVGQVAPTYDVNEIRASLQGGLGTNTQVSDEDIADAMLQRLVADTGASRYMTPMMRNWVLRQGQQMLAQRNLQTLGEQARAYNERGELGQGAPEMAGLPDYMRHYFQSPRVTAGAMRGYTGDIARAAAAGGENDYIRRLVYENPNLQMQALQAGVGDYAAPFRQYAANMLSRGMEAWRGGGGGTPTFWEYMSTRLPGYMTGMFS